MYAHYGMWPMKNSSPCSPAIPVVYIIDLLYVESRGNLCGWTNAQERLGGFHNKKKQPPENTVPATRDCLLFLADKRDPMVGPCKAVLSSTVNSGIAERGFFVNLISTQMVLQSMLLSAYQPLRSNV